MMLLITVRFIYQALRPLLVYIIVLLALSCGEENNAPGPIDNPEASSSNISLSSNEEVQDAQGNTYRTGFIQASSNNQNPYVIKTDSSGNEVWYQIYEETGVDGRGLILSLDEQGNPWVVFTVDGGSDDNQYINKKLTVEGAFEGVYMSGYGNGGGPKVSVLARLDPSSGNILKGTFVSARLTDGKTNSLSITKLGFAPNRVAFEVSSAAWPPGIGTFYTRFPELSDADRFSDNSFKLYYEMDRELITITEAILLQEQD